jgi:hypothetical protein
MDMELIDTCIGPHSREYFRNAARGYTELANYHYGVVLGFLAALLTARQITTAEHLSLSTKYLNPTA